MHGQRIEAELPELNRDDIFAEETNELTADAIKLQVISVFRSLGKDIGEKRQSKELWKLGLDNNRMATRKMRSRRNDKRVERGPG